MELESWELMRREAKLLLNKACDSLLLGIELFNRPHDRGRVSGVLIQIDHGFEMFLKAAIVQRSGRIREPHAKETIGFDSCVKRCLSDGKIRFLTKEQALTLRITNGLRDAAQHHLLDISESQFYLHIQSAVTLFRNLLRAVFHRELLDELPNRVLPISTSPPTDLVTIFDSEIKEILNLLKPKRRRNIEAEARLKSLAVLDSTIRGEKGQPSPEDLKRFGRDLSEKPWTEVFPSVALVEVVTDGVGPKLSIRLTKREGPPIQIVPEGKRGTSAVAVRRVNELDFYNLGAKDLAEKLGLTIPKTVAIVEHIEMRKDPDCYKEFRIGSVQHKRYSQKAIRQINAALEKENVDDIWAKRQASMKKYRTKRSGLKSNGSAIK